MAEEKTYLALEADHKWKSFNNLSQIGITAGSETIMDIVVALPEGSELSYDIRASQHNHDAYPYPTGTITIKKYSDSACDIEHVCSANNEYRGTWRMYAVGSSNTFILSDWVQVYDSVNPPTAELIGAFASGTATVTDANDLTDGVWDCDSPMSNLPMSAPCIVYQKSYAEGYTVQECTILLFGTTYKRVNYGGWSEWKKVYDENNPPTAEGLGALPTAGGTMTGNIQFDKAAGENGYGEVYKYHSDWLDYGMRVKDVTADGAQAILIARASKQAIQAELTPAGGSATVYYIPLCTQDMKFSINDSGGLRIEY